MELGSAPHNGTRAYDVRLLLHAARTLWARV